MVVAIRNVDDDKKHQYKRYVDYSTLATFLTGVTRAYREYMFMFNGLHFTLFTHLYKVLPLQWLISFTFVFTHSSSIEFLTFYLLAINAGLAMDIVNSFG